ncbi:MAG: ACT domain-containing protein [Pseudomonadota bacterium]
MGGQQDLEALFAGMSPVLNPGTYGFATVTTMEEAAALTPVMIMHEAEAITVILPWNAAEEAGLTPEFHCCWITLNIHSALDAVGFLAAISTRLAGLGMGMGVNPVAGFYHDHLFVPADRAEDAMQELARIVAESQTAR